jgi:hypothetical protein
MEEREGQSLAMGLELPANLLNHPEIVMKMTPKLSRSYSFKFDSNKLKSLISTPNLKQVTTLMANTLNSSLR